MTEPTIKETLEYARHCEKTQDACGNWYIRSMFKVIIRALEQMRDRDMDLTRGWTLCSKAPSSVYFAPTPQKVRLKMKTPEQAALEDLSKYWTFIDIVPREQIPPPHTDHVVICGTNHYNGLVATLEYLDGAVHRSFVQHHQTDF